MNALQESIAPVGQTCDYNRADGFGFVPPARECVPTGRKPSMELQMRNKTFISSMVGIAAAVAVAGSANAAIAFNGPGSNDDSFFSDPYSNGMVFTVGSSAILVTNLGSYNGKVETSTIGIYAYSGGINGNSVGSALGGTANVVTTSARDGSFSYVDVSNRSITLNANTQYIIVANNSGTLWTATTADINANASGITFNGYRYASGAFDPTMGLDTSYWSSAYMGPNFQFTAVPAPGAMALLGVAGLVGGRRRRA